LRTWWLDAVGTRQIYLHFSWAPLILGGVAGLVTALLSILISLHGLRRHSPRSLLTGVPESVSTHGRLGRRLWTIAAATLLAAMALLLGAARDVIPAATAFFAAGSMLLISSLSATALYLRREVVPLLAVRGWTGIFRLGIRNTHHRPGSSLLCIALIASATFVIASLEAFRQDPGELSLESSSGTGGFSLFAESALPVVYDPNSHAGREAMNIPLGDNPSLDGVRFIPFRVRPGDDTSCLNLYAPREPRILGVPGFFLREKRFAFQATLAESPAERKNQWLILERSYPDGAIPAIGDANTIDYILHMGLGQELVLNGTPGPVRLRLAGALRDSIFQGELLISESNFLKLFPEQQGFRFFLLDAAPSGSAEVTRILEERLADWGFDVGSTTVRLASYHRVENAYLSTFQSLGALGLVLGTAGLGTVLFRNVMERRRELALLRAVGYRRIHLAVMVIAENLALMIAGLACGTVCSMLAVAPALLSRGAALPAVSLGWTLAAVLAVGLGASILAVVAAFRAPLLSALREE